MKWKASLRSKQTLLTESDSRGGYSLDSRRKEISRISTNTMEKTMPDPNFIILYVNDPMRSADFYAHLMEKQPVEASPTFAMFALDSGVMLGLWSKHTVVG